MRETGFIGPRPGWRVLGPGGGGCVHGLAVNPLRPSTMLVSGDMTAGYLTRDGGESWRQLNLRTRQWAYAFDPVDPDTIYVGTSGLWRSSDGGDTWRLLHPDPARVLRETRLDDESVHLYVTEGDWPGKSVAAILVDPRDRDRIVLALKRDGFYIPADHWHGRVKTGLVLRESLDRGATWRTMCELDRAEAQLLAADPFPVPTAGGAPAAGRGGLLLFTERDILRIGEGGGSETLPPPPGGLARLDHACLARLPSGETLVFMAAITGAGSAEYRSEVWVSRDGCRSWRPSRAGLAAAFPKAAMDDRPIYSQVSACAADARRVYAVARRFPEPDGRGGRVGRYGVLRSDDAGETWTWVVRHDDFTDPPNRDKGWAERDYGAAFGDLAGEAQISPRGRFAWDVVASPVDPDRAWTMDFSTVYETLDGGASWRQRVSVIRPDGAAATRGIDIMASYDLVSDPFDASHLAIPTTDAGLFHSTDGGESWRHELGGVPREWINTCYSMVFDPDIRGKAWSAWTATHNIAHRVAMLAAEHLEKDRGGVCLSLDGLRSWRPSNAGLPALSRCTQLLLDPESPPGARRLFLAVYGDGVYRSTYDGVSWERASRGIDERNRFVWRLARHPDGSVYAVVVRNRLRDRLWPGALYRSTDSAEKWSAIDLPPGVDFPSDLTIDPEGRLHLACWPRLVDGANSGGGAWTSGDGGASWSRILGEEWHVVTVGVDRSDPRRLYAGTFDAALLASADSGASWRRVEGYDFQWGYRPVPDARRPGYVYMTTFGGGVWHGPVGKENA